ncbi:uncharacterized protein ACA1_386080 [Acanthamoeba castellanii str. Neff]|uniref:Uncharacterized protein n=1 Tax=Acanthamoeba castellanii (strain ATCC 30010 / Neff) TaxID=1257118 RepID=L8H9F8_ACACF|nr:uncharacterized protein ACA1_386080 [Acanthamoeba castellanii str. Neff]ELR21820.1 hypothetical protein ACA1_386080 [Acanthamoeba castellanii str. Neff]
MWQVQEDLADWPSATSTPGGDQEQNDAAQIEAELTNLRKLRQKYGQHELRITCVGTSKAGKTTFAASSRAALQDEEFMIPPHLAPAVTTAIAGYARTCT